ncbi:MAG: hypothetical protein OHK93_001115 [Ramalina farinacea]|uniref:Uncharacterized protein n=1 Tax=Ramalina farinacea TaxID=258253 RepID=A0AA43TSJ4_9LECA|nr:hypothetical protein [Ramalina farinacea]
MAFQQPIQQPSLRPVSAPAADQSTAAPRTTCQPSEDDSREWILFPRADSASLTKTTSTERTPKTAGLSRLSDFGSLNTIPRSGAEQALHSDGALESDQEDAELDSLDDGLQAFQEPSLPHRLDSFHQDASVFPRHDGLGTFPASSPEGQDQIWHFERYNPRKRSFAGHHRRRSSVQRRLEAVEENDASRVETEKRERIEKWRLDHSRILLDEIEKQTRQRRFSVLSQHSRHAETVSPTVRTTDHTDHTDHPLVEPQAQDPKASPVEASESMIERITRRVIRDFIGLDDAMMSVIYGESLPEETQSVQARPSTPSPSITPAIKARSWESRLLNRLARELGMLFDQLTDPTGPLNSPSTSTPSHADYAGIPITERTSSRTHPRGSSLLRPIISPTSPSFDFNALKQTPTSPTAAAADSHHASLWGIEEEPAHPSSSSSHNTTDPQEYWSQPPNLRTVFRLLHSHFTSPALRRPTTPPPNKNIATTSTPDSLRRAAIIRQHHPLTSKLSSSSNNPLNSNSHYYHTASRYSGSYCGSQSLRRAGGSRRGGGSMTTYSMGAGSSSRNFWDLGGQPGPGSSGVVGGGGGLGMWGEV